MAIVKWSSSYSIGIDFFDQQHENLIYMINLSQQNLIEGVEYDKVREILIEMVEYAMYHFKAEEDFMEQIGYAKIEKHRKVHLSFVDRIQDTVTQIEKNNYDAFHLILKLNNYLKLWLMDHIQCMDKEMGHWYLGFTPIRIENTPEGKQKGVWDMMKNYEVKPNRIEK